MISWCAFSHFPLGSARTSRLPKRSSRNWSKARLWAPRTTRRWPASEAKVNMLDHYCLAGTLCTRRAHTERLATPLSPQRILQHGRQIRSSRCRHIASCQRIGAASKLRIGCRLLTQTPAPSPILRPRNGAASKLLGIGCRLLSYIRPLRHPSNKPKQLRGFATRTPS